MSKRDTRIVTLGRGAALLLGLAGAATAHAGTPSFAAQQVFTAGSNPSFVTTADLNGDGKPDLIVAGGNDNAIDVLLSSTAPGAGAASFSAQQAIATEASPWYVQAADVNGDGKLDLVVGYQVGDDPVGFISVLLNTTPAGATTVSFAAAQDFAVGNGNFPILAVADLDGDGKPDVVVTNDVDCTISVLANTTSTGSATVSFASQQTIASGSYPAGVAIADLNGDGLRDVVVSNAGDADVAILLNTTSGGALSFADPQVFATGARPGSVAIADFNADGLPDIVVDDRTDKQVAVLLNGTAASSATFDFAALQPFGLDNNGTISVAAADMDGDGMADIIASAESSDQAVVLSNTGDAGAPVAGFSAPESFATGANPYRVIATDLNGDGKPDLVSVDFADSTISVHINTTP